MKVSSIGGGIAVIVIVLSLAAEFLLPLPKSVYQYAIALCGILAFGCYLAGKRAAAYPHKFSVHPTSYIGQTSVHGVDNMRGYWWYAAFSLLLAWMPALLGGLLFHHYLYLRHMGLLLIFLNVAVSAIVGQGAVPIDLAAVAHILLTVAAFTGVYAMNIMMLIFFSQMGALFPPSWRLPALLQIACGFVYVLSFVTQYKPGLFQKFWILSSAGNFILFGGLFALTPEICPP
jgi:hypothetical protein